VSTMAGADGGQVARTVVQNVKITAVGQRTTVAGGDAPPPPNEMFRSVTLLVKLEDAEAIDLAASTGRPRLVLRGGRDNEIVATAGVSIGELRGAVKKDPDAVPGPTTQQAVSVAPTSQPVAVAIAKAEKPHRTVKVICGGQESTVTLDVIDGTPDTAFGGNDMTPITDTPEDRSTDPFDSK